MQYKLFNYMNPTTQELLRAVSTATLTVILSLSLYSCVAGYKGRTMSSTMTETREERYQRNQDRLRRLYGQQLTIAAETLALEVSDIISPKSGREQMGKADIYGSEIIEDQSYGYVLTKVTLRWQARDLMKGVPYDWCELRGDMYYYPQTRRVEFRYTGRNEHVVAVSKDSHWRRLDTGLAFMLR